MSDTLLNIQSGTLPQDCYPASADAFQKQLLALARAVLPNGATRTGDAPPTDDLAHDYPWFKTDSAGNFLRTYTWGNGGWTSLHPIPATSSARFLWVGNESDLGTYDEGDGSAVAVTDTTGPFWVVDHAMDGRFPIGSTTGAVNPLPSGLIIPPQGTGGEENHSLILSEMPPHTHAIDFFSQPQSGSSTDCLVDPADKGSDPKDVTIATESTGGDGSTPSVVVPHNNMPPYFGVFLIKRTGRLFYVG